MSEETRPANIPYFSNTKRDGVIVPILETIVGTFLSMLAPLLLIPLVSFGLNRWVLPGFSAWTGQNFGWQPITIDMQFALFAAVLWAAVIAVFKAPTIWDISLAEWMEIMRKAMNPGDANGNDIPDYLEELLSTLLQDSNGDGQTDLMDILKRYNGGEATVYVQLKDKTGAHTQQDELPYGERLVQFAREIEPGKPMTVRRFGMGRKQGCIFEPPEWSKLSSALVNLGYATKINPNSQTSSIVLTAEKGEAWREAMIEQGSRIEREIGSRPMTYTDHFLTRNPSPTAAD